MKNNHQSKTDIRERKHKTDFLSTFTFHFCFTINLLAEEHNNRPGGHVNIDGEDKQKGMCGIQSLHQGRMNLSQPLL